MASYYKETEVLGYAQYYWATSYPIAIVNGHTPGIDVTPMDTPRQDIPDGVGWDEDSSAWLTDKLNVGAGNLRNQLIAIGSDDSGNGKIYFESV